MKIIRIVSGKEDAAAEDWPDTVFVNAIDKAALGDVYVMMSKRVYQPVSRDQILSIAEISHFLTHKGVWAYMVENSIPSAFVCKTGKMATSPDIQKAQKIIMKEEEGKRDWKLVFPSKAVPDTYYLSLEGAKLLLLESEVISVNLPTFMSKVKMTGRHFAFAWRA